MDGGKIGFRYSMPGDTLQYLSSQKALKRFFSCRHLQRRHITIYNQYLTSKSLLKNDEAAVKSETSQPKLTEYTTSARSSEEQRQYPRGHPRQSLLTDSIVKNLVIGCNIPVSLLDHPKFRQCFKDFEPKFSMPCRQTASYSIIPSYLVSAKAELIERLKKSNHVALTTDAWTDRRSHAFLGIFIIVYFSK